jgi:ATP-dependent DNA helicase RecQ
MISSSSPTAAAVLEESFGFTTFRQGQEPVIERLLAGRSTLAIFPTGAGKSLCYQLPALMLDGITVVISPLIALMKDQIDFLQSRGIAAARLDSSLDAEAARDVYSKLRAGSLKVLYVAPERLANERFLATLARLKIAMLAVDEAHCISEWGHNFRPDYLKLAALAKRLKVGRVLALTATATPPVARQIAEAFEIAPDDVVRTDFHRPNLSLVVSPTTRAKRESMLIDRLNQRPRGPTIVYVTLQRTAEDVAALLQGAGFDAAAYHAGLDAETRHAVQDHFMASDQAVVVATIAFGMGIDKSDIRYVYHFNLPKSLENYAQEIGRAGRDGEPAICEMLACPDDLIPLENFTFGDTPEPSAIDSTLREVLAPSGVKVGEQFDVSVYELSQTHDIRPLVVETLLTYLELDGYLASTGPFYSEYKIQFARSGEQIISAFDPRRREFLRRLFDQAVRGKTWWKIDLHNAALALNEPRERVVAAVNYLEEQGELKLEVAGVRHGYRRVREPEDFQDLVATMNRRFAQREARDTQRLAEVLSFASHDGCRTKRLLDYFGEPMEKDCGHCGWCKGHRPGPLPPRSHRAPGAEDRAMVEAIRRERHEALATPRQLTRFLCGIASPSASRAKLTKLDSFGALADVPFRDVLDFVANA